MDWNRLVKFHSHVKMNTKNVQNSSNDNRSQNNEVGLLEEAFQKDSKVAYALVSRAHEKFNESDKRESLVAHVMVSIGNLDNAASIEYAVSLDDVDKALLGMIPDSHRKQGKHDVKANDYDGMVSTLATVQACQSKPLKGIKTLKCIAGSASDGLSSFASQYIISSSRVVPLGKARAISNRYWRASHPKGSRGKNAEERDTASSGSTEQ